MLCVYIVNEDPTYIGMLSFSLKLLREHNSNVRVVVYYIQDDKLDTRENISSSDISKLLKSFPNDFFSFSMFCEELNVEIRVRRPKKLPVDQSHSSLHRTVLQEVKEDTVLLLDADTFIFKNIEDFPEIYSGYDFVATPNTYGLVCSVPTFDPKFKSFNSGVVLCQNGVFSRWMGSIEGYCESLYNRTHPMGDWLWNNSYKCQGREEFSASLFVLDNNIKYRYYEYKHVQMGSYDGDTCILHTLSPTWRNFYNVCFNQKRKILFKPLLKNNTNTSCETDNNFNYPPESDCNSADS